jgi:hypothetical protein
MRSRQAMLSSKKMGEHLRAMRAAADVDEDDLQREMDAAHSAALTAFLRHPIGYRDLLGLEEPPTTVCHPSLSELWEHPLSEHARLVREAMQDVSWQGHTKVDEDGKKVSEADGLSAWGAWRA